MDATSILITTLIFQIQCTLAILDPVDFLALQTIRKSLHDFPGSTFFTNWDFTSDPCNFSGISCSENNNVIALNLGDQIAGSPGLIGSISPAIGELSSLEDFTIVPGRIAGTLPDTISKLKSLRFVAVSRNFIYGSIPPGFAELVFLQTLDLSFNCLNGSIPWEIGSLPSLKNLILSHNFITGPLPPFKTLTLTRIDLSHNDLSGSLHPYSLPPFITYLSLSSNRLSGSANRALTSLARAEHVDLSMNRFTGGIPGLVFTYPMSNLLLQRNELSGWIRPAGEVTMGTVDLSYNRLSGEISPLLSKVQNLFMNNNLFIGKVPGEFADRLVAAAIRTLYLQHNFLTGIEINPTAEIPVTVSFCLQYNCMVPPLQTYCPLKSGKKKRRPVEQCPV